MTEDLRIVPANEATADDLDAVFARGDPGPATSPSGGVPWNRGWRTRSC